MKTLAYVIGYLKSQMPAMMGKEKKQMKLINDLPNVFRTIMKKYNLSPGDFPEINSFSQKLKETKFSEFNTLNQKQVDELDQCLNNEIPRLMDELPSEKDTPESLRVKMGSAAVSGARAGAVPMPTRTAKFGKNDQSGASNPFGFSQEDEDNYWLVLCDICSTSYSCSFIFRFSCVYVYFFIKYNRALEDSAERLFSSFQALGPVGGFLSPQTARDVLVKTGLNKEQLRKIWNLSDIDRDGHFDHHEYVVAMFLCDAVTQKNRPIPVELPASVVPPSKRHLLKH